MSYIALINFCKKHFNFKFPSINLLSSEVVFYKNKEITFTVHL